VIATDGPPGRAVRERPVGREVGDRPAGRELGVTRPSCGRWWRIELRWKV
jgi:hypothetical protein